MENYIRKVVTTYFSNIVIPVGETKPNFRMFKEKLRNVSTNDDNKNFKKLYALLTGQDIIVNDERDYKVESLKDIVALIVQHGTLDVLLYRRHSTIGYSTIKKIKNGQYKL